MNAIKLLNELKVGTPLIVIIKSQGTTIREVSLYGGIDDEGIYTFIDNDGIYRLTTGFIKEHCTISQELDGEDDLLKLTKIIKEVKSEEGVI